MRDKACEAIHKSYADIGVQPDENGILDIGVSYECTWQKRGHSSHNGIGSVIDLLTGLPIDNLHFAIKKNQSFNVITTIHIAILYYFNFFTNFNFYKMRKMTYMSFTKDHSLNFSFFCRRKPFFRSHFFGYTSGGTIMKTRLH